MNREAFKAWADGVGLALDEAQLDAFARFEDALYEANAVMNLTRVAQEECWLRHFVDSLLFQDLIPTGSLVLDIGTGPGFPSWPLACARPDLRVTAMDSSGKMLGFLRSQPLPNLEVVLDRAESWGVRDRFDVVTGRAVAPLPIQLELSAPPCKPGGIVLPMRTPSEEFDVRKDLGLSLRETVTRSLPGTDVVRAFPRYEKTAPTPKKYPRSWAEIKAKPTGR